MTDTPHEPTPEEVAQWETAVEQVRAQHPDWTDETVANAIAYAVMTPEVQAEVRDLREARDRAVALWTQVINDLMIRYGPGTEQNWTEQMCNDNLIALLAAVASGAVPADPDGVIQA